MRAEKKLITEEYVQRLSESPFFIVVDYEGLRVAPFSELRKRLAATGAEIHVVKNSIFKVAAKEAGVAELNGSMSGQLAVVTGQKDVAAAAKVVKNFHAEFERPTIKFGYLNNERMDQAQVETMAGLPPMDELRSMFLAVLQAPATNLARLLQTPASQLAQVLKAKSEKGE